MSFIKEVEDLHRFNQILLVLFEEGFSYWIRRIRLKHHIPISKRFRAGLKKKEFASNETRLRNALERLGPTFIKFGQLLSVRPDIVPASYIKELEKLQDRTTPVAFHNIRGIAEKELNAPLHKVFKSFESSPIASASISQVHKAVLKNGRVVAVKVQKPNVDKIMKRDIEIMFILASLLERHSDRFKKYNITGFVKEFAAWTNRELDFRIEARNAKRFHRNFEGSKTVHIPDVYDDYTSQRLLVLDLVEGTELHNIEDVKKSKLNIDKVLENGFNAILTQVFIHGFFHADPHPGNILVKKDSSLVFIDYGIVGYFSEELKWKSVDLFYGIIENDIERLVEVLLDLGNVDEKSIDISQFKSDIRDAIEPLQENDLKHVKVSHVLERVMDIALDYGIKMPLDFVLFGKTIITLEGVALQFNPNFRLIEVAQPFIEKLMRQRAGPKHLIRSFAQHAKKFRKFALEFPEQAGRVFKKIEQGTVKIDIEDLEMKKLGLEIDRSSNRIVYGLIIAASIMSGAITITIQDQKEILGIPMLAFISFLIAALFTLILFISILKEGKGYKVVQK